MTVFFSCLAASCIIFDVSSAVPLASPFVFPALASVDLISLPLSSYMFRRTSMFRSALLAGVADFALSVEACGLPVVETVAGPGWKG